MFALYFNCIIPSSLLQSYQQKLTELEAKHSVRTRPCTPQIKVLEVYSDSFDYKRLTYFNKLVGNQTYAYLKLICNRASPFFLSCETKDFKQCYQLSIFDEREIQFQQVPSTDPSPNQASNLTMFLQAWNSFTNQLDMHRLVPSAEYEWKRIPVYPYNVKIDCSVDTFPSKALP